MQTSMERTTSQLEIRVPIDFYFTFLHSLYLLPIFWARSLARSPPADSKKTKKLATAQENLKKRKNQKSLVFWFFLGKYIKKTKKPKKT